MIRSALIAFLISFTCTSLLSARSLGTTDPVPAATLLLPYFEVNLDDSNALSTLFSVRNASAAPVIVNVTLWTDLGIASHRFNLCLDPSQVRTFNLRGLFTHASIPAVTGCDAATQSACLLANVPRPLAALRAAHTGTFAPGIFPDNFCAGVDHGDGIARGYVTIDTVDRCSLCSPSQADYHEGAACLPGHPCFDDPICAAGRRVISNRNAIWGDTFTLDPGNASAQGELLVHLEASATLEGGPTFYRRYTATGADLREPLGQQWEVRFLSGAFDGGTRLLCWRDAGVRQKPFPCGTTPAPLGHRGVAFFSEAGTPLLTVPSVQTPAPPLQPVCPWPAGTFDVDSSTFPMLAGRFGSIFFDFGTPALVQPVYRAFGQFSAGLRGVACDDPLSAAPSRCGAGAGQVAP